MSKNVQPNQTPRAVHVVSWMTVAWFGFLLLLIEGSQVCTGAEATAWWQLPSRYLSCRSANEVGDFLAGAFAPVAFAWLVVTVLIQATELKEQRREMQEGRHVAEAQAKEIGAQTALLLKAEEQRAKDEAGRDAEARLDEFLHECKFGQMAGLSYMDLNTMTEYNVGLAAYPEGYGPALMYIEGQLNRLVEQGSFETVPIYNAGYCRNLLLGVYEIMEDLSPSMRTKVGALPLVPVANMLKHWSFDASSS